MIPIKPPAPTTAVAARKIPFPIPGRAHHVQLEIRLLGAMEAQHPQFRPWLRRLPTERQLGGFAPVPAFFLAADGHQGA